MLEVNRKKFFDDYYKARLLRRLNVKLYKEVFRFESTLHKEDIKDTYLKRDPDGYRVEYDQEGYNKKNEQIKPYEILEKYSITNAESAAVDEKTKKKLVKSATNISNIIKSIDEITFEMSDIYTNYIENQVETYANVMNDLDARYPHYHWAYYCMKHRFSVEQRKEYYTSQLISMNMQMRKKYIKETLPRIYRRAWISVDDSGDIVDDELLNTVNDNQYDMNSTVLNYLIKKAENVLYIYGETNLITMEDMEKKIIFFTGSGISRDSGIPTYYDTDGLWLTYPIKRVAYLGGWKSNPSFVNSAFNFIRKNYLNHAPNKAHKLIAYINNKDFDEDINDVLTETDSSDELFIIKDSNYDGVDEETTRIINYDKDDYPFDDWKVVVITQNLDDLHERADTTDTLKVIHIHGEIKKMCMDGNQEDPQFHITLTKDNPELNEFATIGTYKNDEGDNPWKDLPYFKSIKDKRLRPAITFYDEYVTKWGISLYEILTSSMVVIIGTSLQVNPAAELISFIPYGVPIFYIDPEPAEIEDRNVYVIKEGVSTGIITLMELLQKDFRVLLDY